MSQWTPKILDFLPYHEYLGIVLAICTILLFLLCLAILDIFMYHHHTSIVWFNNHQLSYMLLSSLALCFLCPLLFIHYPKPLTCSVQQADFGVTFTVYMFTVLAKTIAVVATFQATMPDTSIRIWPGPVLPITVPVSVPSSKQYYISSRWQSDPQSLWNIQILGPLSFSSDMRAPLYPIYIM